MLIAIPRPIPKVTSPKTIAEERQQNITLESTSLMQKTAMENRGVKVH